MARVRPRAALILGVVVLVLASWIFIPAPTFFLLTFDVGAPEVSEWLTIGALVAFALASLDARRSVIARVTMVVSVIAATLSLSPFLRLPATERGFEANMRGMSATPIHPARSSPLVVADLFRGIPSGSAKRTTAAWRSDRPTSPLTIDAYQPETPGRYPILVQIYGGAWQRGSPASNANFAKWLASRGWVVFAIDYRHAPAFRWPAQLDDVDSALAWVRDHAAQYDGDTSRVVLLGRSAGAHLAMLAAYREPPLRVRGVVNYYGPVDLVDTWRNPPHPDPIDVRAVEETLIGAPLDSAPAKYAAASPLSYATRQLPPTLLIYGGRDHIVEPRYGERLRNRLLATHTPVAYLEIPWAGHGFDAVFNGPSSQLALYHIERFLTWATHP